jgi:hypothetical protein
MRNWNPSSHLAVVLDIINEQTCIVESCDDGFNIFKFVRRNVQPFLKGVNQYSSDIFSGYSCYLIGK